MQVMGIDEQGNRLRLPSDTDEYYSRVAGQFAGIQKMIIKCDNKLTPEGRVIKGDFALLRAFLEDHYNRLFVEILTPAEISDKCDEVSLRLFFPAYLYGFVEDTFARAIHHKIEGIGYALREVVGKYELRIREYDTLFAKVIKTDAAVAEEAGQIALSRLTCPLSLLDAHREAYHSYLKEKDQEVLSTLAQNRTFGVDPEEAVAYLTKAELLSRDAVRTILPILSDTAMAPVVATLLTYLNETGAKTGNTSGRLSLW